MDRKERVLIYLKLRGCLTGPHIKEHVKFLGFKLRIGVTTLDSKEHVKSNGLSPLPQDRIASKPTAQ